MNLKLIWWPIWSSF